MEAAKFYLFVVLLYAVLNHRCADGGVHRRSLISFLNPVETVTGVVKDVVDIANGIKQLASSPTYEIDDLLDKMSDLSHTMETMEQNLGAQITDGFENLQQQFQTQAELSNYLLEQLQAEAMMSYQMMQRLLKQAKLSDRLLQRLLAQAKLSHRLLQQLHSQSELSDHLQDLNDQIGRISRKYSLLKQYTNGAYENYTLNEFATTCISSDGDGVPETLAELHSLIKPDKDRFRAYNLLKHIGDDFKGKINTAHCSDKRSDQYLLYGLLNLIVITEVKGLALMQFSYMFLRLHGHGNFKSESQSIQNRYQTRLVETLDSFRTAMSIASPDLWRCDPPEWIEKDTYAELGSVFLWDLRQVIADVGSNKVMTGIRFVNTENVIHLRIERGELLAEGMIRANTTEWVYPATTTEWVDPINTTEWIDYYYRRTKDYVLWTSLMDKGIELNDVASPPGHCLTGVKLTKGQCGVLKLEIMTTPFDFQTGKLIEPLTSSSWYRNDDTTPTTSLELKDPVSSTLPKSQSIPNFRTNQRIPFRIVDTDQGYEKWHVAPLIDIQPVLPSPRVVLAGAGIYHKGRDGYRGFIAPKLKTYNFGTHLRTD